MKSTGKACDRALIQAELSRWPLGLDCGTFDKRFQRLNAFQRHLPVDKYVAAGVVAPVRQTTPETCGRTRTAATVVVGRLMNGGHSSHQRNMMHPNKPHALV